MIMMNTLAVTSPKKLALLGGRSSEAVTRQRANLRRIKFFPCLPLQPLFCISLSDRGTIYIYQLLDFVVLEMSPNHIRY